MEPVHSKYGIFILKQSRENDCKTKYLQKSTQTQTREMPFVHLQTDLLKYKFSIHISQRFIFEGLIDNTSGLVQVMAWPWTNETLLPKTMMTKICVALLHH